MAAPDRITSLTELHARMVADGLDATLDEDAQIVEIGTRLGASMRARVRWVAGHRFVQLTFPLATRARTSAERTRAALALARLNSSMPVPALALDVDSGWIDHRARLFVGEGGALDYDLLVELAAASVRQIERILPSLDESLRGEDADLDALEGGATQAALWCGYAE